MTLAEPQGFWIDGELAVPSTSHRIEIVSASTGEIVTAVPSSERRSLAGEIIKPVLVPDHG